MIYYLNYSRLHIYSLHTNSKFSAPHCSAFYEKSRKITKKKSYMQARANFFERKMIATLRKE